MASTIRAMKVGQKSSWPVARIVNGRARPRMASEGIARPTLARLRATKAARVGGPAGAGGGGEGGARQLEVLDDADRDAVAPLPVVGVREPGRDRDEEVHQPAAGRAQGVSSRWRSTNPASAAKARATERLGGATAGGGGE